MGPVGLWTPMGLVGLIIIYSLCSAALCCGEDDHCRSRESRLRSSSPSSSLPGIHFPPLDGGCEKVRARDGKESSSAEASSSAFVASGSMRRLGEEGESGFAGMRLSLAHRSSHPSEVNISPELALRLSLERDKQRVNGIVQRILSAESEESPRSKFRADFPDLMNPGGKKEQVNNQSAENSTTGLYKFESTVASGVPLGSGEYFMDMYLGTPPRHFSVIIDSGSDLTWLQCDPCRSCYEQKGPLFQPNMSSTYEGLTCDSTSCIGAGGYGDDARSCQQNSEKKGVCRYFYNYGDASNTTGDFALETMTFNVTRGDPLQIEKILFGCGHSNIGLFQGGGGLLGLGQGSMSFVSQVKNLFGDRFSYCLVDRENRFNLKSPLIFGEDESYARLEPQFQWTPFLIDTPIETFYYIHITGVSVGGVRLEIADYVWQYDKDGYGGSIIDSGTTLSYFVQDAYDVIKKAFEDRILLPKVTTVPVLDLCYNLTQGQSHDFPSMSFTFIDNAVMELPLKNYFIRPDPAENIYCLAMLGVEPRNLNIIGNFQQQNFHVVYDRKNTRLGFAPVDCSLV